jgi:hypothetical protein
MLEGIKRWLSGSPAEAAGPEAEIREWALSRQAGYRAVPGEGFVIDGRSAALPWRLEWGPSQRPYIGGHELRLRAELSVPAELQLMVLDRALAEAMERTVFEQFVEDVQTRIDTDTPPEMRWLVMFPKLTGQELGAPRDRLVALGNAKHWLQQWLDGPLAAALASHPLEIGQPLVLTIGRGRLTLRTALAEPDVPPLQSWLRLFETALRECRRVADLGGAVGSGADSATPGSSSLFAETASSPASPAPAGDAPPPAAAGGAETQDRSEAPPAEPPTRG